MIETCRPRLTGSSSKSRRKITFPRYLTGGVAILTQSSEAHKAKQAKHKQQIHQAATESQAKAFLFDQVFSRKEKT